MDLNLYNWGHVLKSLARDGERVASSGAWRGDSSVFIVMV